MANIPELPHFKNLKIWIPPEFEYSFQKVTLFKLKNQAQESVESAVNNNLQNPFKHGRLNLWFTANIKQLFPKKKKTLA